MLDLKVEFSIKFYLLNIKGHYHYKNNLILLEVLCGVLMEPYHMNIRNCLYFSLLISNSPSSVSNTTENIFTFNGFKKNNKILFQLNTTTQLKLNYFLKTLWSFEDAFFFNTGNLL